MNFKTFLIESDMQDAKKSLSGLPKAHKALVSGFKIVFQDENTIKGDGGHVGYIDEAKKTITIAAPWNYGREYAFLHEVGHLVWKYIVDQEKKKKWEELYKAEKKKHKKELDQNSEEIFCMIYSQFYVKNKIVKYDNKTLLDFVKTL